MVNRLSTEERARIIGCLVEGMSIRATVRATGAAKNTIVKLLADLGAECAHYQDVTLRNLSCTRIECDEIWSYCYAKAKNVPVEHQGEFGYGDVWTWTAICADTKLVPSWLVGERTTEDGTVFMRDLASRLDNRIQLTTDGLTIYPIAVESAFFGQIDYAMLHKKYGAAEGTGNERRYSPAGNHGEHPDEDDHHAHIGAIKMHRLATTMRAQGRRKEVEDQARDGTADAAPKESLR